MKFLTMVTTSNPDKAGPPPPELFQAIAELGMSSGSVLKDTGGAVFGAFVTDTWRRRSNAYYGNGTTFLFTLAPNYAIYPWTQTNDYFIMTT